MIKWFGLMSKRRKARKKSPERKNPTKFSSKFDTKVKDNAAIKAAPFVAKKIKKFKNIENLILDKSIQKKTFPHNEKKFEQKKLFDYKFRSYSYNKKFI